MCLGVALATVGVDPVSGYARFDFGSRKLLEGLDFMPVVMGLYGIVEVLASLRDVGSSREMRKFHTRELIPTRQDMKDSTGPIIRGGLLGFFMGLIPGPANIISTFVSYGLERKLSRRPEEFGLGAIAGVAGPESANNGATAGALVPLLSLGLPFSPIPAILLAGFIIHGVLPGPLLIKNHPHVFWGIIASMYVGNVMLLILNLPLVGLFTRLALVPPRLLMPVVLVFCFLGAFAVRNSVFDLYVLVIFGIAGYLFRLKDYDPAPLTLGLIIGPMLENALRQTMIMFGGDPWALFTQPLCGTMMTIAVLVFISPIFKKLFALLRPGKGR
jgi:putative tricarboxylic transport membrane protein